MRRRSQSLESSKGHRIAKWLAAKVSFRLPTSKSAASEPLLCHGVSEGCYDAGSSPPWRAQLPPRSHLRPHPIITFTLIRIKKKPQLSLFVLLGATAGFTSAVLHIPVILPIPERWCFSSHHSSKHTQVAHFRLKQVQHCEKHLLRTSDIAVARLRPRHPSSFSTKSLSPPTSSQDIKESVGAAEAVLSDGVFCLRTSWPLPSDQSWPELQLLMVVVPLPLLMVPWVNVILGIIPQQQCSFQASPSPSPTSSSLCDSLFVSAGKKTRPGIS